MKTINKYRLISLLFLVSMLLGTSNAFATSFNFYAPSSTQFKVGDPIDIGATMTSQSSDFLHYHIIIKNSSGTEVFSRYNRTETNFWDTWNTGTNPAGTYTFTLVWYRTNQTEENRITKSVSLLNPVISSFSTNSSSYRIGDNVIFSGSASYYSSWKIVWLKGSTEEAATGIQNNTNISYSATVNSTAYTGAKLYIYSQSNGSGTVITKTVNFTVNEPSISSFTTNKSTYAIGETVTFSGSASNYSSWKIVWLKGSTEEAATSIQNNTNISYSATVNSTAYTGAKLYIYPQSGGSGTAVVRSVGFTVSPDPVINSFTTNSSSYIIGSSVTFSGSASNYSSWKIVWLKGSTEEAATGIQNNTNISYSATVNSTAYTGAKLYIYSQSNGSGTVITKTVNFTVNEPSISSFTTNKSTYAIGETVTFNGSASNYSSWKIVWLKGSTEEAATSIQNNTNISYSATVNSTAYTGAKLYIYPQSGGSGTAVVRSVGFSVSPDPVISSFTTNSSSYIIGSSVSFSGSASNYSSWKIVWLKGGTEEAATSIQNNTNISYSATVNSTAYTGARLYVYSQSGGSGTTDIRTVSFSVNEPSISSFSTNKSTYAIGETVTFSGSASNYSSWKIVWLKGSMEEAATSIQNNTNISYSASVNSAAYTGARLYVYSQSGGSGTTDIRTVSFSVYEPSISSFTTNKSSYTIGETVTFSGSASNYSSWKIVWLKGATEEAATSVQNNTNISYSATVNSTAYTGAKLYIYSQSGGSGTVVTKPVSFTVISPNPAISSFTTNSSSYRIGSTVTFSGSASNYSSWKIVWLKGSTEEVVTGIQNNTNISYSATVNSTAYTGARLYVYSQSGGSGTTDIRTVSFTVSADTYNITTVENGGNTVSDLTYTVSSSSQTKSLTQPTYATYTVSYNANGHGTAPSNQTSTKPFSSWSITTNSSPASSVNSNILTIPANATGDITVTAQWGTQPSITLSAPTTVTGYTFNGWYGESACTNFIGNGGASYTPTANKTLYAKWTAIELTVSLANYNFETARGTSSTINIASNQSWTISENVDWLTLSKTSGSNNNTFTITAEANTANSTRVAQVTVQGGGITRVINVTQKGIGCQVGPFITTKWNQGAPYNNLVKSKLGDYPTGCTATAMAQVMKFWETPKTRTKAIPAYTTSGTYKNGDVVFQPFFVNAVTGTTTYEWANMSNTTAEYFDGKDNTNAHNIDPNSDAKEREAVSTLMYECGVSIQMNYTPGNSGAWPGTSALPTYFGYEVPIEEKRNDDDKYKNNPDSWNDMLRQELDKGQPVIYVGWTDNNWSSGHTFVCDGYDCSKGSQLFHFNFGWDGDSDDYYVTTALDSKSHGYEYMQSVIRNIKPSESPQFFPATAEDKGVLTINATKSSDGILIPSGTDYVYPNDNKMYSFTPHDDYVIDEVKIDDVVNTTAKANGYYTFQNITENHTISVTFKPKSGTGIEDVHSQSISVYPNPATNDLFIKSELPIKKVVIYSLAGTLMKLENNFNEKISVSSLPQGVYLLKVYTDKGSVVSKIVKN